MHLHHVICYILIWLAKTTTKMLLNIFICVEWFINCSLDQYKNIYRNPAAFDVVKMQCEINAFSGVGCGDGHSTCPRWRLGPIICVRGFVSSVLSSLLHSIYILLHRKLRKLTWRCVLDCLHRSFNYNLNWKRQFFIVTQFRWHILLFIFWNNHCIKKRKEEKWNVEVESRIIIIP